MQGQSTKAQKTIARAKGWEPDSIYDSMTRTFTPIDSGLVGDSEIFNNQGVPKTKGRYPQLPDGYDVSIGAGEPAATFNSPVRRSETGNAPFKGAKGNPNAGMGGM